MGAVLSHKHQLVQTWGPFFVPISPERWSDRHHLGLKIYVGAWKEQEESVHAFLFSLALAFGWDSLIWLLCDVLPCAGMGL